MLSSKENNLIPKTTLIMPAAYKLSPFNLPLKRARAWIRQGSKSMLYFSPVVNKYTTTVAITTTHNSIGLLGLLLLLSMEEDDDGRV